MHLSILGSTQSLLAAPGRNEAPSALLLCHLNLRAAGLLARAEATVTFVKVDLKHLMVLAWSQGRSVRPLQFGCAALQSKPITQQQKETGSESARNTYAETLPLSKRENKNQP